MTGQGRSPLEVQKAALARTADVINALHPYGARDLDTAFERTPGLVSEAANGRTANAIRQMQLEAEVRADPELRADRFVQAWQQLQARRGKLSGWENEDKRAGVENAMRSLAKGLEKDPALGAALSRRGNQLFGRQWSPEWTPGSRDGGVSRALGDDARTRSIIRQLTFSIDRDRGLGIGM
jgi:hypothetical protein